MNKNFHTDLMILSGETYKNGKFQIPEGWQQITTLNAKNGFQATVYKKDNEVVISYRGTDQPRDLIMSDIQMNKNLLPEQYSQANGVYQEFKQIFPDANITVTGHSLGGSLAQLVSAEHGCLAVTFNAYGTGDILKLTGHATTNDLNIINYGNPNDPIFTNKYMSQPGQTFLTNTDFNSPVYWDTKNQVLVEMNLKNHKIENMGALEDAVEVEPMPQNYNYDTNNIFHAAAQKTFTREDIARMSNDEFAQNEQMIMQQLKNGQIKTQKSDYSNFSNPITGSKKIYTKEELDKMSPEDFIKKENEIMAQLQSIGIPTKCDLPKSYTGTSGQRKWVTINGNHVLINK